MTSADGREEDGHLIVADIDLFPAGLMQIMATGQAAIDRHVNEHGVCRECGWRFPCERAQQADLALSAS